MRDRPGPGARAGITHRFGLTGIHAALEVIRQGTAIKATIEP